MKHTITATYPILVLLIGLPTTYAFGAALSSTRTTLPATNTFAISPAKGKRIKEIDLELAFLREAGLHDEYTQKLETEREAIIRRAEQSQRPAQKILFGSLETFMTRRTQLEKELGSMLLTKAVGAPYSEVEKDLLRKIDDLTSKISALENPDHTASTLAETLDDNNFPIIDDYSENYTDSTPQTTISEPSAPRLELVTNPTFSDGYATPLVPEKTLPIPIPEPIIQPQAAGEDSQQRFADLKKAVVENGRILQQKQEELDQLKKKHAGNPPARARLEIQHLEREIKQRQTMRHMVLEPLMGALVTNQLFLELSKKYNDALAQEPKTKTSMQQTEALKQQKAKLIREAWEKIEGNQQVRSTLPQA